MRIVAGKWGGRHLVSPSGRVRPTAEEVRGAWLTALEGDLKGARVLDLYAGSGALGLEALSRGAASCDFVEHHPSALHSLKSNVTALRARDRSRIFKHDAAAFLDGIEGAPYDLVLADPPYGTGLVDRLVERWRSRPFSRILSIEHASDHRAPRGGRALRFDRTTVTIWRAPARPDA